MAEKSKISWTSATWNPWRGCAKVSAGCDNCYMFRDQIRYGNDPEVIVRTKPNIWNLPKRLQKQAIEEGKDILCFTCSWSDWFIQAADAWRPEAWQIIRDTPNVIYQILTKRPKLMPSRLPPDWGDGYDNVGLGVSIENNDWVERADDLRKIPAKVRFISAEPLLGPVDKLNLEGIHWLITGGESGPNFRDMDPAWAIQARDMCRKAGVAFFHKQGSNLHPGVDNTLEGQTYEEWPPSWTARITSQGAA